MQLIKSPNHSPPQFRRKPPNWQALERGGGFFVVEGFDHGFRVLRQAQYIKRSGLRISARR
ncbi:MAG: hypothetical protein HC889_18410 [Synechococcaceae cyanobacterium SM1_2_3]|nr:hypothetical protein [Synechococcaceae cyanobacterium SM1_2_3]